MLEKRLNDWAAERGFRIATAGTGILRQVREKLESRLADGQIDRAFFRRYVADFRGPGLSGAAGPQAILMVAVPRPAHIVPLGLRGEKVEGLMPPTYVQYRRIFRDVLADLDKNVLGRSTGIEILKGPLKSLAVHAGLAAYGRNNITYVPGFGSGHQICGYVIGARLPGGATGGESVLARCASCRACIKACPSGAIREDRFLISAEKWYTLFSESRGPIPARIGHPKRLCLIGCLACQERCPENKGRLKFEPSGIAFTAEETDAILDAGRKMASGASGSPGRGSGSRAVRKLPPGSAWASARAKYATLGPTEDLSLVGRNILFQLGGGD